MGAKNKVIAGDYQGLQVGQVFGLAYITLGFTSTLKLDRSIVRKYEVVDESSQKSAVSAVGRAALGAAILGPAGLVAGVTAKNIGIHIIAVEFKDGKKSLMEIDDKIYKAIMTQLF